MAKYIGRLVELGIGRETERGVGVAPTFHVPKTSFSFDDRIVQARSIGSLGKISDSEEAFVTTQYGQGDLEGEIRDQSFGLFLYGMLGALSTDSDTPESDVHTHKFSIQQGNQHQSLTFLVIDLNTTEMYKLVMLDSLEITAELDEVVRYVASFFSKKGVETISTVPIAIAENKFTKKHLSFKVATNIAGLGAAQTVSLKNLVLTIQKNVSLDDVLGTAEPEDILNRQLSVEGTLTLNYEDETWKNYMKAGTARAMEIAFTNNDATIGVSTNPSLTLQFPNVDFFDWEPDYSLEEIVSQTISFKASRKVTGGVDIISTCDLINEVISY